MSKRKLRRQVCLFTMILYIALFVGCSLNPLDSSVTDTSSAVSQPVAVTDLKASNDGESSITVTFTGMDVPSGYSAYYDLHYWNYPDTTTDHMVRLTGGSSTEFSKTFTSLQAGTQMVFWVTCSLVQDSSKAVQTSSASSLVEGSTLPKITMSTVVSSDSATLYWNVNGLFSVFNQTENTPIHPYSYTLKKTIGGVSSSTDVAHQTSATESLAFSNTDVSFQVVLNLYNDDGSVLSQISSEVTSFTTDVLTIPPQALTLTATQGTSKDSIGITWTLDNFNEGITDTVEHRVQLDRAVHGSDTWTTLLTRSVDINTASYGFTADGTDGKASYAYTDTNVATNTEYDYRLTTYYRFNGTVYVKQTSALKTTDASGYRVWLPSNLRVTVGTIDGSNLNQVDIPVTLAWDYDKTLPSGMQFSITRNDQFTSTKLNASTNSYSDTITLKSQLTDYDSRYDHTYSYRLVLDYGDGTYSTAINGDVSAIYTTTFQSVSYITDATCSTDYADKIKLTWKLNSQGITAASLDASKITLSLKSGATEEERNSSTAVTLTEGETVGLLKSGDDYTYDCSVDNGVTRYYSLIATYNDAGNESYNGSMTMLTINGKSVGAPQNLTAEKGGSTTAIKVTFDTVADVSSYILSYKKSTDVNYTEVALAKDITEYSLSEGAGTSAAGTLYDFKILALDNYGTKTSDSAVVQGCLLGPALLNTAATKNANKDHFNVTWNEIAGATSYTVKAYFGTTEVFSSTKSAGESSYNVKISTVDIGTSENNKYPLSEVYEVKVVPSNADAMVEVDTIDAVDGCWVRPPKNIKATKGASNTKVTVTWDNVGSATGYNVYTKSATDVQWTKVQAVTTNSYEDNSGDSCFYSVTSVINGIESPIQEAFGVDGNYADNYGFIFQAPTEISTNYSISGKTVTMQWKRSYNATKYIVSLNGDKTITLDDSGATPAISENTTSFTATCDQLSADVLSCTITIPFNSSFSGFGDFMGAVLRVKAANDTLESLYSDGYGVYPVNEITQDQMKTWMTGAIKTEIDAASSKFGGDWWSQKDAIATQQTYTNTAGTVIIKNSPGTALSTSQSDGGSISMSLFALNDYGVTMSTSGVVRTEAVDTSYAGYLGVDDLKYIKTGTFIVALPDMDYINNTKGSLEGSLSITTTIDVKANTGKYSVTWNGQTQSYDYTSGDLF